MKCQAKSSNWCDVKIEGIPKFINTLCVCRMCFEKIKAENKERLLEELKGGEIKNG